MGIIRKREARSSGVFSLPKENRTIEDAEAGIPIAETTWEGAEDPEEQADPEEAQIPSMSKAARKEELSEPVREKEKVFGSRAEVGPSKAGKKGENNSGRLDKERMKGVEKTGFETNLSTASAMPTQAATFSVPGRLSFS